MPMPKKTCKECQKPNYIGTKVCECGAKIGKAAQVKKPIAKSTYVPTGKPRGRPPKGHTWDEKKKKYVKE